MIMRTHQIVQIVVEVPLIENDTSGYRYYKGYDINLITNKLFPDEDNIKGIPIKTCYLYQRYVESHRVTMEWVGKHNLDLDLVISCNSERQCMIKYFSNILDKEFEGTRSRYQVFTTDTLLLEYYH